LRINPVGWQPRSWTQEVGEAAAAGRKLGVEWNIVPSLDGQKQAMRAWPNENPGMRLEDFREATPLSNLKVTDKAFFEYLIARNRAIGLAVYIAHSKADVITRERLAEEAVRAAWERRQASIRQRLKIKDEEAQQLARLSVETVRAEFAAMREMAVKNSDLVRTLAKQRFEAAIEDFASHRDFLEGKAFHARDNARGLAEDAAHALLENRIREGLKTDLPLLGEAEVAIPHAALQSAIERVVESLEMQARVLDPQEVMRRLEPDSLARNAMAAVAAAAPHIPGSLLVAPPTVPLTASLRPYSDAGKSAVEPVAGSLFSKTG
jgi:hypothetical protein